MSDTRTLHMIWCIFFASDVSQRGGNCDAHPCRAAQTLLVTAKEEGRWDVTTFRPPVTKKPASKIKTEFSSRDIAKLSAHINYYLLPIHQKHTRPAHHPKITMKRKRVSFSLQQTAYFSPPEEQSPSLPKARKEDRWYSEAELSVSRDEARTAIQALHDRLEQQERSSQDGPLHDDCRNVCVRGVEKYAHVEAIEIGRAHV